MKSLKHLFLAFILFGAVNLKAQNLDVALRQIKVGNSLREAQQFEQAEKYLFKGLQTARKLNNKYWEAVACENIGLLYANTEEDIKAQQYFNTALELYESLKMTLSAKVVKDLTEDYNSSAKVPSGGSNAQLYGGIEIGSKGIKYSIIKVKRKNGVSSFTSLKDGSNNVTIIEDFSNTSISKTVDAVKAFKDSISNYTIKIPPENIFIAVSSGVKEAADKMPGKQTELEQALTNGLPDYGKKIQFLTACEEGNLTIKGVVPSKFLYKCSLIDIGSGNSKGGYREQGEKAAECFSLPWGSVTFANKFKDKENKVAYAEQFFKENISDQISSEIRKSPGLTNRAYTYFNGGIIWAMCNYLHPERVNEDFTEFTKGDIDKFLNLASTNYNLLITPDLSRISDEDVFNSANKQIARTKSTFNQDNIIAGALILKGIVDQLESTGPQKRYAFARYGYVGWISGYIVNKIDEDFNKVNDN
jgi:hypothetical protein